MSAEQYHINHLNQINGGKITQVGAVEGEYPGELWQILRIEKDGKTFQVEVSQDAEGNGPGHLFIGAVD